MLLRFRVSNHRSLRDEQELSLVAVTRKGEPKSTGPIPPTVRVAGIYGANASGKSNILHAYDFFVTAIRESFARWPADGDVPRHPFLLDTDVQARPSRYEIDVAIDGVRYTYGFEVDNDRVCTEWLYSYHASARRRILFRRDGDDFSFGRSLAGANSAIVRLVRKNALYLSVAAANGHEILGILYSKIAPNSYSIFRLGQGHPHVPALARAVPALGELRPLVEEWLRLADPGIVSFELERATAVESGHRSYEDVAKDAVRGKLRLLHSCGPAGEPAAFAFDVESAGTQIWLAVLLGVMIALDTNSVFLVDEVDSSLHPKLSAALIRIFKDPVINRGDAQLVFTSHDVSLLGNLLDEEMLERDEVWFTEKDSSGASTLFPLTDFHPRKGENLERAYLQGRYGAVPYVDLSRLRTVFGQKDAS